MPVVLPEPAVTVQIPTSWGIFSTCWDAAGAPKTFVPADSLIANKATRRVMIRL